MSFAAVRRFVDVDTLIVTGLCSAETTQDIATKLQSNLDQLKVKNTSADVLFSTLGPWILAKGAASLSFHNRFMADSQG